MRRFQLARPAGALACCLALAATPAMAEMTRTYSSGQWSAFSGTLDGNHPVCAMSTTGPDGRRIAIQQNAGETGLHMLLDKSSWNIPRGTPINVALQIDQNATMALQGKGNGSEVNVDLPFDQAVPMMRELRKGLQLRLFFPGGNEPMWHGGLAGTAAVMNAFNDCRAGLVAAASGPTQPYAAPAGPPSQPYTPAPGTPGSGKPAPGNPAPAAAPNK